MIGLLLVKGLGTSGGSRMIPLIFFTNFGIGTVMLWISCRVDHMSVSYDTCFITGTTTLTDIGW